MTDDSVSMYLPFAVVEDIDKLVILHIVRWMHPDAAASIGAFIRSRDLDWTAMGLASVLGRTPYQHVYGSVVNCVNCPRAVQYGETVR